MLVPANRNSSSVFYMQTSPKLSSHEARTDLWRPSTDGETKRPKGIMDAPPVLHHQLRKPVAVVCSLVPMVAWESLCRMKQLCRWSAAGLA
jgi:hypothetical protein